MAAKARSWDWAAQRLWSDDAKCNVRLLDTVLLDAEGRPQRWLFASKHGHVAKKKDDHVSLSSIRDRFARFSAHPKNVLRHTAYAFYRSGKRELLDATQFSSLLDALDGPPKHRPSLAGLVAYVHSSSEHALAEYRANNGVSLSSFDGAGRARKEMERATLDVVSFLQTTAHVTIAKLGAEFVLDDDSVVWLSHLPQMLVEAAPGTQSLPSLAKTDAPSSVKCAGEFCRYSDVDLPGLYATPPLTPLPLADTGQRTKIGYNNILLARAAMGYLLSRSDDAAGWDALDAAQRAELGQSNPSHFYKQVGVCPNCHTIYAQLQTLRHNRFSHEVDRPTSSIKKKVTRKVKSNGSNVNNKSSNNQQPQTSDSLLKFMGVAKPSADAHEAAFLAELHRQSQLLEPLSTSAASSARLPEDDAASTTEAPSVVKRIKSKKGPARPKDNQVLAQFEAEWSAVESANKSLVAENARLTARLADTETARQQEQVQWATDRAQLLESNEVLERQTKALGKRLSALQKEFSDAMAAKDNEWTRRLLETEQLYSARSTPPPSREVASGNQLSLIETIEQLSAQLESEQREREMDRQRLAATHQADVQRVHDRLQLETEALRIGHRQQLDTIEELKTQLLTTSHQLQVAQAQTKQAKAAALDAQVAVSTLEDKLVALEAKSLPPALLPTTAAVDSAANEKLQHKIEYLKAQLASETRCKEELGATVATLTANLDSLKRDRKKLSSDLDEAHRKQLEKADARYRAEVETVQAANAALQSKMATLQANVADLVADLAASRNKEESAKLSMEKLASESVRLHARMAELEATNEELQEAANGTKSSLEDAQRATMEATLRRLTHERQYLKSQMDGEIRRKDDAEAKVRELQAQLADATTSTKAEVIAAKQAAKDKETALSTALAKLEETQLLTQGELSSTKHQLHDAKIALIGARDESQRACAELETQRADLAHLKTSLLSTREELLKERDRSKLNAERQSASLQAIKASLVETEASKAAEITALHNERTQLRSALAEAQSTRLALAASLQAQSVQQKQQVALLRVALSTAHREATRVLIRWEGWTRHVACHRVQESGAQKLKEALQAREVVWHDRLSVACADVHEKCTLEKDLALAAVSERLLTDAADAARAAASVHTQALADCNVASAAALELAKNELTSLHDAEVEALEASHVQAIEALQEAARQSQAEADAAIERLEAQRRMRETELQTAASAQLTQALREMELAHSSDLREVQAAAATHHEMIQATHAAALSEARTAAEALLDAEQGRWQAITAMTGADVEARWLAKAQSALAMTQESLVHDQAKATQALISQHDAAVADTVAHWTQLLTSARTEHAAAIAELRAAADTKLAAELETCRREMAEQKGNAVMTTTAKWQRALADTTARIDTEKKVAYDKGVSDREAEWQRAAALIKQAQKDEVDALERDSRQALAACEERFGLLLAAKTQELQAACAATVDAAAATAKAERERAIAATRDAVVEATEARVIAEWTNRMNAAAVASDQQLRDACAEIQTTMQNEAEAQLAAAKARWSQLKTDEIATLRAALRSDHYQQLQDELGKARRAHETQLAQLQTDHSAALASTTAQLRADADAELQTRLRACQETANQQHEAEMSLVQEESEKLIDKVEIAMQQLKKQKEATETELHRVTHALEEAEDAAFDLQEEMSSLKKKYVMRHLLLLRSGLQKMQIMEDELDTKDMEKTAADRAWQAKLEATTSDLSSQLTQSKTTIDKLHEVYTTVYETLVNYRRDELVQHRSASNVVTSELDVLHAQIDQVLHSKHESDREIEKAQADLGTLEDELSGIQLMKDGHVNQAQVARKRRLHQETEALLEAIDSKKAKARGVEVKLNELYGLQRAKEDEMKGLERHLVTILVEQQKHLLTLVSSVKSIAAV